MSRTFAAYCRACDAAREASGTWPGACRACRTPVEAHPVPDVIGPGLRLLFVGINPGIMTARTHAHFGNPRNPFWAFLHGSGITPERLEPGDQRALLRLGLGVTNVVTRATPGSADVTRDDIERGRARLASLLAEHRPRRVAFVGKQAATMASGGARFDLGPQPRPVLGIAAFVLPSTSPANASVSPLAKLQWFQALARELSAAATP